MKSFIALYRGNTVASAKLIAVSADPKLVADFASRLLSQHSSEDSDSVTKTIDRAKNRALKIIKQESEEELSGRAENLHQRE